MPQMKRVKNILLRKNRDEVYTRFLWIFMLE